MNDNPHLPTLAEQLSATTQRSATRSCFLLRVRPERLPEYVEAHQHVWEEMRAALSQAGWRNYSLFLQPKTGTVVGYFEADDVDIARREMTSSSVNAQWQAEMARYFVLPDGGTEEILPQYFYLP
jgi:L-rhamnose mutarotase